MNEDTIVTTAVAPLPYGRRGEWHADANLIRLAPGLSQEERNVAISELVAEWRRGGLRVISGGAVAVAAVVAGVAAALVVDVMPLVASQAVI